VTPEKAVLFTPLPPAPTGIADYSALLIRELGRHLAIETISNREEVEAFRLPTEPHVLVYQVGNSPHHDFLYPALFRHPGILVLHDLVLHHARLFSHLESPEVRAYREDIGDSAKRESARRRIEEYRAEARDAYPEVGEDLAEIALRIGGGRLLYSYPLYEHLVRRSRLTLVHGETARDEVLATCPGASVRRVRMEFRSVSFPAMRPGGSVFPDELLIASFGLITQEKRISTAIRALARLEAAGVRATYVLVGGTVPHYDPLREAREAGVAANVRLAGRVSDEEFRLYAFASDLCLNLRYPSAGETSATLLSLLACGRAVVVTDQVHARDLPENVVARSALEGDEDGSTAISWTSSAARDEAGARRGGAPLRRDGGESRGDGEGLPRSFRRPIMTRWSRRGCGPSRTASPARGESGARESSCAPATALPPGSRTSSSTSRRSSVTSTAASATSPTS
jgi:glycosyltransferase involved in cell wall biosynthesis